MKWIKVTDRLPETPKVWHVRKTYLVKFESGEYESLWWYDGWNCSANPDGSIDREYEFKDVVAWIDPDGIED